VYTDKLKLITEIAKKDSKLKFKTLAHNINAESLTRSYKFLKKNKACGIDGVTIEKYGNRLEENISDLLYRMKGKKYKACPVRRTYIPKAGKNELRPLGIPCVEDKMVQTVLKEILEAIYEQDFLECSHGFRPCHTAIKELNTTMMKRPINYVVEVDIKGFFDNVDHEWLMKCLQERIVDKRFLRWIRRHLEAGVMEDGSLRETNEGTPQGGVVSPVLANIYLHYVLDLWFEWRHKREAKGYVQLIRYCDDFIVLCESECDAKRFLEELVPRLAKFNLEIAAEKTKMIKFGRSEWKRSKRIGSKMQTFNFLGFTHYCGTSRKGWFSIKHKTAKQNLARKLRESKQWVKNNRNLFSLKDWWRIIKAKLIGHYNYFGVSGNMRCLRKYYRGIIWMLFKWINRRSQKKSMNIKQFWKYLQWNPLPTPRIKYFLW